MWWLYKVRYDNMYYYDVVRYSSSDVTAGPCKSKGQHPFSLLLFIGCSSGCSSGLGWATSLLRCLLILSWMTSLKEGMLKSVLEYDLLHTGVHLLGSENFWLASLQDDYVGFAGVTPTVLYVNDSSRTRHFKIVCGNCSQNILRKYCRLTRDSNQINIYTST
jgi:hypothetical protein